MVTNNLTASLNGAVMLVLCWRGASNRLTWTLSVQVERRYETKKVRHTALVEAKDLE